ncbi:MAG: 4'-phosphopantetheinyl transferase superfamily protein [Oscillospiraceae bacterium]|nr:4'-phosphopantetheinyl transferase superfamily protein [Oscillospiraceae bacterium]
MIIETYHVDMPHFRELIKKPKFLARLYSPQEMKFLMKKNFSPYITAEMYCAKMAFRKVMGANFSGCDFREISVLADYTGGYYISLSGEAKHRFMPLKLRASVSCSHSKSLASSTVLFYDN